MQLSALLQYLLMLNRLTIFSSTHVQEIDRHNNVLVSVGTPSLGATTFFYEMVLYLQNPFENAITDVHIVDSPEYMHVTQYSLVQPNLPVIQAEQNLSICQILSHFLPTQTIGVSSTFCYS